MRRLIKRLPYRPKNPRIILTVPKKTVKQRLWSWFKRLLMVLGAFSLASIILTAFGAYHVVKQNKAAGLPDEFVLAYKFERSLPEAQEFSSLGLPIPTPTFYDFLKAIDLAKEDDRIKGMVVRIEDGGYSLSQVQEIRAAIENFRSSGKFAYAISSSYGDFSNGLVEYYLATAFEEIWLQPVGNVSINGFMAEMPFMRGLLKKIGVKPEFYTREEFKSAMENLTEDKISKENRITIESILGVYADQFMADVSSSRDIDTSVLKRAIDNSPLTAEQAKESKLVDVVDYADTLYKKIKFDVTGDEDAKLEFVGVFEYFNTIKSTRGQTAKMIRDAMGTGRNGEFEVGMINLVGMIVPGSARSSNMSVSSGNQVIFAEDILPDIYDLAEDENIKAIIVRIDSPGGSPTASETIRRALSYAQSKGKKVIVSMASVAASGGYWIASTADHIVANPTTITGSIGVVAGKIDVSELLDKLGVNFDRVSFGDNADFWSVSQSYDEKGEAKINQLLDNIYNDFLARVSAGRNLEIDKVREIAKGRAWTGVNAEENGLVDTLGGLNASLEKTAEMLGAFDRHDLSITVYPKPKTPLEVVVELLEGSNPRLRGVSHQVGGLSEILTPAQNVYFQAKYPELFATHIDAVSLPQ